MKNKNIKKCENESFMGEFMKNMKSCCKMNKFFLSGFLFICCNLFSFGMEKSDLKTSGSLSSDLMDLCFNNPYSYMGELSENYMKAIEENLTYLTIVPKKYDLSLQLKLLYPNEEIKTSYSLSERNKIKSKASGAMLGFEYGLTDNSSLGLAIAGITDEVSFPNRTELTSNAGYVGVFGRTRIENVKLMLGAGYLYNGLDGARVSNNSVLKSSSNYDVMAYNVFAEARYQFQILNIGKIEPKIRGSYYGIYQKSISENGGAFAVDIDKKDFNTGDIRAGVDFINENIWENGGKTSHIFSLEFITTFGKNENLVGYKTGDRVNSFNIPLVKGAEFLGKASYAIEIEQSNGMNYMLKATFEAGEDNLNYRFTAGVGYKFATYTESVSEPVVEEEPVIEEEPVVPEVVEPVEIKRYTLNTNFGINKVSLRKEDKEKIKTIADEINERNKDVVIAIVGHTDSTGKLKYNINLSKKRAEVVGKYLKSLLNEDAFDVVMEMEGKGPNEPIASNATREGRAKNRRVEVRIFE